MTSRRGHLQSESLFAEEYLLFSELTETNNHSKVTCQIMALSSMPSFGKFLLPSIVPFTILLFLLPTSFSDDEIHNTKAERIGWIPERFLLISLDEGLLPWTMYNGTFGRYKRNLHSQNIWKNLAILGRNSKLGGMSPSVINMSS